MSNNDIIDRLTYIAESPPREHGGFHEETIRTAKEAITAIRSNMPTLYAISNDLAAVLAALDDTGELTPELAAQLDALEGDFAAKAERVVGALKNYGADSEVLDAKAAVFAAEAHMYAARAETARNKRDDLKGYLKQNLERLNLTRLDAGLFKIRIQRNGRPSVHCDVPLDTLPESFVRRKLELVSDAVLAIVKAGGELPAGVRVEQGSHLRVS